MNNIEIKIVSSGDFGNRKWRAEIVGIKDIKSLEHRKPQDALSEALSDLKECLAELSDMVKNV